MMIAEPSKALNLRCALDLMRKPGTRMIISSGTYYIVPVGGCVDLSVAAKIIAHPQVSAGEDGLFPGMDQTWRLSS
jgi:hypothetical protein